MAYIHASTENPLGFRPGTVRLGYLSSGRHRGPDWKTVVAQQSVAATIQQQRVAAVNRRAAQRASDVDAIVRGATSPVLYRGLSGLRGLGAYLPSNTRMVSGAVYVFHFSGPNSTVSAFAPALQQQIAADSNFVTPVVSAESSGMRVSFVYGGGGTSDTDTVANYGAEMQNVLKSQSIFSNGFLFAGAEGGPVTVPNTQQVFVDSNGNLVDANGNIVSQSTSNPGDPNATGSPSSGFNWSAFLAGMGLSVGVGTALAVGLGIVLLKA